MSISLEDNAVVVQKGLAILKFDFRVDLESAEASVLVTMGLVGSDGEDTYYLVLDVDEFTSLWLSLGTQAGFNDGPS